MRQIYTIDVRRKHKLDLFKLTRWVVTMYENEEWSESGGRMKHIRKSSAY